MCNNYVEKNIASQVLPCAEAHQFKTGHTVIPEHSMEKYIDGLNWVVAYLSVRPHLGVFFLSHILIIPFHSLANTPLSNCWNCWFESPRVMEVGLWRVLCAVR
jgi:hypothetical protein